MNIHKFAVLISARNEEKVIGKLIDSLHAQTYPLKYIDVFVVADNCSDCTAEIARGKNAIVYERKNDKKIGKGYALNYLFKKIEKDYLRCKYDAYIIFDADNLAQKDFVAEIDKIYTEGYKIVTTYRNSKNFDKNWISATSGIYFLHHSRLFRHRFEHNICCAVLGAGFLIDRKVIKKYNGWQFFTLGEDAELSIRAVKDGIQIGYADNAIFYDEQPTKLSEFWNQRLRWVRGHLQVASIYKNSPAVSEFDPLAITTMLEFISLVSAPILLTIAGLNNFNLLVCLFLIICLAYVPNAIIGISTVILEKRRICSSDAKRICYAFFFPVMILIFILATLVALFSRDQRVWKAVRHDSDITVGDLEQA